MARRAVKVRPTRASRYFLAGDSTAFAVQSYMGVSGMAVSGVGFTPESSSGFYFGMPGAPSLKYRAPDEPAVVVFASLWDYLATDLSAYSALEAWFAQFGVPVYWVGIPAVPGWPPVSGGPISQAGADAWNADLAAELGHALDDDGTSRYVSIADGTSVDDIHPWTTGAALIDARMKRLVGYPDASHVRGAAPTTLRGELGPALYGRAHPAILVTGRAAAAKASTATGQAAAAVTGRAAAAKASTATGQAAAVTAAKATVTVTRNVVARSAGAIVGRVTVTQSAHAATGRAAAVTAAKATVTVTRNVVARMPVAVAARLVPGLNVDATVTADTRPVVAVTADTRPVVAVTADSR